MGYPICTWAAHTRTDSPYAYGLPTRGRSPPWNIVEALGEIWNFIRIFPFTISVYLLYIYANRFSVCLSSLTSSILSFPPFRWTFKVKKHHESVKRAKFLWNLPRNLKYRNMKFNWNLKFASKIWNIVILPSDRPLGYPYAYGLPIRVRVTHTRVWAKTLASPICILVPICVSVCWTTQV